MPRASKKLTDSDEDKRVLRYEAGAEALPLWEEIWRGPAMKLVGPLAARSPGLRLAFALEIERHGRADEVLQCLLIDLVAFVDVDGAPGILTTFL